MSFWDTFLGIDPTRKRGFPGEQPGEEVIYLGVLHWMVLVPFFVRVLGYIAIIVGVNMWSLTFDELASEMKFLINSAAAAAIVHKVCFRIYNYFLKVMLITNYRLIEIRHTVFLIREREIIPMENIQDIRFHQNGILPRLFKYGNLVVLGSSSDVKYEFHHVPKVNKVHHILGEVYQKAARNRPRSLNQQQNQPAPMPTQPNFSNASSS